jgi:hypothetical protein
MIRRQLMFGEDHQMFSFRKNPYNKDIKNRSSQKTASTGRVNARRL